MTFLLLLAYNILLVSFLCIFTPFALIFSSNFRRNISYKLKERLVLWKLPVKNLAISPSLDSPTKKIWFHCSSIGEVRAIEPLFTAIKDNASIKEKGGILIFLTVVTKTARKYAENIKNIDFVSFFPIDIYPLMRKAFKIIQPDIFAPIETELWPSMISAAHFQKIKIISVNGRISQKTFKSYKFFLFFWSRFISFFDLILARSDEDAMHYRVLSKNKVQVLVSGNIKYDRDFKTKSDRKNFNLEKDDIVFTAGSIREGEEKEIVLTYKDIAREYPNLKFFVAPRHLEMVSSLKTILEKDNIDFCLFSDKLFDKNFIIVDVFGILQDIYGISDLCFIGGSLIDKGGQNPIEAASFAKAVLFGKHTDNFKTESKILIDGGGAIEVCDQKDLSKQVLELLSDRQKLLSLGNKAFEIVQSQKGAIKFTIEQIRRALC